MAKLYEIVKLSLFVLHFYDVRDSIEFCANCVLLSEYSCSTDTVKFCCPSLLQQVHPPPRPSLTRAQLLPDVEAESSCLVFTLQGAASPTTIGSALDWVQAASPSLAP